MTDNLILGVHVGGVGGVRFGELFFGRDRVLQYVGVLLACAEGCQVHHLRPQVPSQCLDDPASNRTVTWLSAHDRTAHSRPIRFSEANQ